MYETVVFGNNCKTVSALFQGPSMKPLVSIQEVFSKTHGFCKFSGCEECASIAAKLHQLFQAAGCCVHLLFTDLCSPFKEPFQDWDQSWEQMLGFSSLAIQTGFAYPWLLLHQ